MPTSVLLPVSTSKPWITFHATKGTDADGVAWSPDSRYVLIQSSIPYTGIRVLGTDLVDESGTSIHWYPSLGFGTWLDSDHFLLFSSNETRPGYDWRPDVAWVADASGSDAQRVEMPHGTSAAANGHGAVAISRYLGERNDIERDEYWVWSNGDASGARSGFPYNWSADGSKLAVVHPFAPTRGTLGWLEIVGWPGLATVWKEDPPQQRAVADFDPTGQFVALPGDETMADNSTRYFTSIVDLANGESVEVPATSRSTYFWANGYLNTIGGGEIRSYDTSGNLVTARAAPGDFARASADGSTVVYMTRGDYPQTSAIVERGGTRRTIDFPSPIYYAPEVSPDGRAIDLNFNPGLDLLWLTSD